MSIKKDIIETEVRTSGFKKIQEDIMLTNKKIEEYNDELKHLNHEKTKLIATGKKETKAYREITKEITKVRNSLKASKAELKDQERQLPLTGMSYNQLKKKAGELTKELYNMSEAVDPIAFTKARGELKQYQDQMSKMQQGIKITNASFKNQKPSIWSNLKQLIPLASITAIGAKLTSVANQAIQTFARLDDKMADVQKTTQMSKTEVKALDAELMKIDTRTSREELLDLARVAGKLGVAKTEVAGFVRSADQIRVALTEDLGGNVEESIRKIGKLADIFKIKDQLGLEKSLQSIGSAINSLGAASTANEENIVDFTNRTAGIAPQAKVSIQNVMGLGAAIDILGQSAEVGGTTYSQVMTGMFKRTEEYAKVAGMSVKEFTDLLNRDANEAFIKFLEGANSGGDMGGMTKKLAELKLEGTRSTQVLGALAGNVELLRNQQTLSNAEFAKATSLQDEANTKNASAQALIEKRKKDIDQVVAALGEKLMPLWSETLGLTASFMSILKTVIGTLIEYRGVIITVATVTSAYIAVKKLHIFYSKANRAAIAVEAAGIIASNGATIAATLGAKALATAKMLVTFQFRAAAVAAKAFFVSLGPIGWAIIATTALVGVLIGLKKATADTVNIQKKLGATIDSEVNKSLAEETNRLSSLRRQLIESEPNSKRRIDLVQQLKKEYPDLLKNINSEKITLDKVISSIDEYVKKSETRIRLHVIEQKYLNNLKELEDARLDGKTTGKMGDYFRVSARIKKENEILLEQLKYQQNLVAYSKEYADLIEERDTLKPDISVDNLLSRTPVTRDEYEKEQQALANSTQQTGRIINAVSYDKYLENFEKSVQEADNKAARFKAANTRITEIEKQKPNTPGVDIENGDDGGDDKKEKRSLSSDEAYMKAKAELRERQMKGDITSEEEYSRLLLALEINTLKDRIALNKEKSADLSKLKSELAEKQYQQTKSDQARTEKLLAAARTPYESEMVDYDKRLKELGLFGVDREQMTEDQQRALLKLEKAHQDKLHNLWLNGLSKQESERKEKNDAELRELRTKQNNELAAATTLEQKKDILRQWFSDAELQRVTTKERAQKVITAKYQEEEQTMLKKYLENTIASYNLLLSGAVNPLFALGLTPEMRAKMKEELEKLQEELSKVNLDISQGDTTTTGTDKSESKSKIDILGFSEDQWEDFFKKSESVTDSIDKWNMALQAVGNTFGMISDLMTAAENREFKKYEQTANKKKKTLDRQLKSGTISQERYNEAVQRIDTETDTKREEMERKQAKRQKALAIFQAITNTAIGITAALTSIPPNPAMAWVVGAIGAVQLGTILATPLPGFEQGGLIGVEREQDGKRFNAEFAPRKRGYVNRPTVIQTGDGQPVITGEAGTEYVVPNHLLQVPQIASMVGLIEASRLSGTFRPVNLPAALATIPIPGRADGGYMGNNPLGAAMIAGGQVSTPATSDDGLMRELKEVVGKLSRQLEKPLPVAVSAYGRDGILTVQKKIEQQQRRAGIGGRDK